MDLLLTIGLITTLSALAALGVVALPWSVAEVDASAEAWEALGEGVRQLELARPGPLPERAVAR
jgi:hypothetical protein